jgi:hypothetical protein
MRPGTAKIALTFPIIYLITLSVMPSKFLYSLAYLKGQTLIELRSISVPFAILMIVRFGGSGFDSDFFSGMSTETGTSISKNKFTIWSCEGSFESEMGF